MYKLLIVDDEPMIVEGLKAYILAAGYPFGAVDTAPGGREALSLMEKQLPDLLITDIRMPHLDGIGLLSAVRERKWATKVIVLSGYNDFEYVRSMAVLGIENYLLKPVNEEELYATVSATIKKLDNRAGPAADGPDECRAYLQGKILSTAGFTALSGKMN